MSSIVTQGERINKNPYSNDYTEAISMFLQCRYDISDTENEIPLNGNMVVTWQVKLIPLPCLADIKFAFSFFQDLVTHNVRISFSMAILFRDKEQSWARNSVNLITG